MQRGHKAYKRSGKFKRRDYFQSVEINFLKKVKLGWHLEGWHIWNLGNLGNSTTGEGMKWVTVLRWEVKQLMKFD